MCDAFPAFPFSCPSDKDQVPGKVLDAVNLLDLID